MSSTTTTPPGSPTGSRGMAGWFIAGAVVLAALFALRLRSIDSGRIGKANDFCGRQTGSRAGPVASSGPSARRKFVE